MITWQASNTAQPYLFGEKLPTLAGRYASPLVPGARNQCFRRRVAISTESPKRL
jgi:hypothetical protein